jgi:hypothetical protein
MTGKVENDEMKRRGGTALSAKRPTREKESVTHTRDDSNVAGEKSLGRRG